MKVSAFFITILFLLFAAATPAQITDMSKVEPGKNYLVTKNDGITFMGRVISMDPREIVMNTKALGDVSIPKHDIKEMRLLTEGEVSTTGDYKPGELFATRYFITTNGLPVKKGDSYILWNWYGPDMQFGIAKNFGVGIMTTWLGVPVVASAKYSIQLDKNLHVALGTLLGTGSWALPKLGIALPFASFTYGNRRSNITVSGGYGAVWGYGNNGGRVLCSVAGMAKVSNKAALIFDSFILPAINTGDDYMAIYMPGIRFQTAPNRAFQFGFAGFRSRGEGFGLPMVQWFRML
ncbi:MAG: hypothetical protein H7257_14410 [Taibaiella sp.]|nr:hypothetical protein [Taibaiella sp.]